MIIENRLESTILRHAGVMSMCVYCKLTIQWLAGRFNGGCKVSRQALYHHAPKGTLVSLQVCHGIWVVCLVDGS